MVRFYIWLKLFNSCNLLWGFQHGWNYFPKTDTNAVDQWKLLFFYAINNFNQKLSIYFTNNVTLHNILVIIKFDTFWFDPNIFLCNMYTSLNRMCEIHSTYIVYHLFKTYMEKDHFECCSRIVIHSLSHIYRPSYTHTYTHKHTHIHSNFWEVEIVGFSISLSTQRDRHALGRLASFYGSDDFNWFPSSFFRHILYI